MYMQGIDFTFYWLTGERTHLYLGCWKNTRSKKLANGVLPVCLFSYFVVLPKESAAWWALALGNDLLIIDRGNVPVRDQSLFIAWRGAARMHFLTPPFKWCFIEVILLMTLDKFRDSPRRFRHPPKKHRQQQEERRKATGKSKTTMQGEATGGTSALVKLRTSWDCRHFFHSRIHALILHAFKLVLSKHWILLNFFYDLPKDTPFCSPKIQVTPPPKQKSLRTPLPPGR